MTRDEALEILKPILFFDEEKQKALSMAIEALEKATPIPIVEVRCEKGEKMSDLISRKDAIEAIRQLPNVGIHWYVSAEAVFDVLLKLPSAERKQGKNISEDGFLCSVCTFGDFGGFHGYEPNFCPNCGANMDEREEKDG